MLLIRGLNDELLACFAGNEWHEVLEKAARAGNGALLQLKNLKITLHLLHKDEIDIFSSKQSFEEKSLSSIMMMKFFALIPYLKLPHVPAGHY